MVEQPAPIILTDVQNPTLEIEGDNDAGPENNHFVIGFVLIGFAILCVWTLEEFCCLMGIFSLVGGFISIISGLSRTYNWRKGIYMVRSKPFCVKSNIRKNYSSGYG